MKNYVNLDMAFKEYAVVMHVVFDTRHLVAGEVHAHRGAWSVVAELYPLDLRMILRPSALCPAGVAHLCPTISSTAMRFARIRRARFEFSTTILPYYFFKAFRIFNICRGNIFSLKSLPIISFARMT